MRKIKIAVLTETEKNSGVKQQDRTGTGTDGIRIPDKRILKSRFLGCIRILEEQWKKYLNGMQEKRYPSKSINKLLREEEMSKDQK